MVDKYKEEKYFVVIVIMLPKGEDAL